VLLKGQGHDFMTLEMSKTGVAGEAWIRMESARYSKFFKTLFVTIQKFVAA
jgi:hypothetical protein